MEKMLIRNKESVVISENDFNNLENFFKELYYKNGLEIFKNCYDYEKGKLDIFKILETIKENNLKISVTENL